MRVVQVHVLRFVVVAGGGVSLRFLHQQRFLGGSPVCSCPVVYCGLYKYLGPQELGCNPSIVSMSDPPSTQWTTKKVAREIAVASFRCPTPPVTKGRKAGMCKYMIQNILMISTLTRPKCMHVTCAQEKKMDCFDTLRALHHQTNACLEVWDRRLLEVTGSHIHV